MWRRIYFSFPHKEQARRVVFELEAAGVRRSRIHTIANPTVDITGFPMANDAQRSDQTWLWEKALWYGNLTFFALMLMVAAVAVYADLPGWAIVAAVLAIGSFVVGRRFAVKVPHAHLAEMRVPLAHGEVVLLVDVPRTRVHEIEQLVSRHHPEAGIGGVGWTIASAGI